MIYRLITCALVGILAHAILTVVTHDRFDNGDEEESLVPAILSLVLAILIEVIAWEILGLIGG